MTMRRRAFAAAQAATAVTSLVALALVPACKQTTVGSPTEAKPPMHDLTFEYEGEAEPGYISQTISILNHGDDTVVPTLAFIPIDDSGSVIDRLTVRTAYGSDRGIVVVPPGDFGLDVLAFHGQGADRVADVRVQIRELDVIAYPEVDSLVEAETLDDGGRTVDRHSLFDTVRLSNQNSSPVTVCVVYLVYNMPEHGDTQQVRTKAQIAGPTEVAANGTVDVAVSGEARSANRKFADLAPVSVKAYFCRPHAGIAD